MVDALRAEGSLRRLSSKGLLENVISPNNCFTIVLLGSIEATNCLETIS